MGKEMVHIPEERLRKLYLEDKVPMSNVAKIFGCSLNTVSYKLRSYGIKPRTTSESVKLFVKKKKIKIPANELINLYENEKLTLREIADRYNCAITTIMNRLREYAIPMRRSNWVVVKISKRELEHLYIKKRLSTYAIAGLYGCCQATIWKRLRQFKIRARTPHELYSNVPSKRKLIELYVRKKLSTWEIEKKYGYSRSTVHRKLREYSIKTRSAAESHRKYDKRDFSGNLVEKAYLIGFRIGDLRIRKAWENSETIQADCGSTKIEQIDLIRNLFHSYGGIWVSKPNKSGKIQIEAYLNLSFSFLLDKKVPRWILKKKLYFFSFLAGFTDAEGCISISQRRAFYSLGNYDSKLLFLIHKKLNEFGIKCRKPYETDTSRYFHNGYGHNQNYWSLSISRKFYLLKLLDTIKPHIKHEKKIKDLNRAKRNIIERNKKFGNLMMRPKWRLK